MSAASWYVKRSDGLCLEVMTPAAEAIRFNCSWSVDAIIGVSMRALFLMGILDESLRSNNACEQ